MIHTTQAIAFSHFPDLQAAVSYVVHELLSTLQDDLQKMEGIEAKHYGDEDRQEMNDRIADIEAIGPFIENLPVLHVYLKMVANLETSEEFKSRGGGMENDDAVNTVDHLVKTARNLLSGIQEQVMSSEENDDRLFRGIFPTGISYADTQTEKHGDYKRLAFLSFATLKLDVEDDCPEVLAVRIKAHADSIQARKGEQFQISTSGQTITLGYALQ
jgi:hypothetical protein